MLFSIFNTNQLISSNMSVCCLRITVCVLLYTVFYEQISVYGCFIHVLLPVFCFMYTDNCTPLSLVCLSALLCPYDCLSTAVLKSLIFRSRFLNELLVRLCKIDPSQTPGNMESFEFAETNFPGKSNSDASSRTWFLNIGK